MTWLPFTDSVEPVINPASSEARKTTQCAISSGSRPSGICGHVQHIAVDVDCDHAAGDLRHFRREQAVTTA